MATTGAPLNLKLYPTDGTRSVEVPWDENMLALNTYAIRYCELTKSATQSFTSTTSAAVTWDTEVTDTSGMHNGTNTARITPPGAGIVLLGTSGEFAASAAGTYRQLRLLRFNSAGVLQEAFAQDLRVPSATGYQARMNVVSAHFCNAGDYFEVWANQDSGGALNFLATVVGADQNTGRFWLAYLGKL